MTAMMDWNTLLDNENIAMFQTIVCQSIWIRSQHQPYSGSLRIPRRDKHDEQQWHPWGYWGFHRTNTDGRWRQHLASVAKYVNNNYLDKWIKAGNSDYAEAVSSIGTLNPTAKCATAAGLQPTTDALRDVRYSKCSGTIILGTIPCQKIYVAPVVPWFPAAYGSGGAARRRGRGFGHVWGGWGHSRGRSGNAGF